MHANLPTFVAVLACLLALGTGTFAFSAAPGAVQPAPAAQPAGQPMIQVNDGLLTVRLDRTPLGEVAQQLSAQTGVEFVFADDALRQVPVSAQFQGRPLTDGLTEMAERFNTVYVFDRAQHLKIVHILPKGEPSPGAPPSAAAPREEPAAPPPPATVIITPPPPPGSAGGGQTTRLPGLPPGVQVEIRPGGPEPAPPAQPDAGPLPTAPPSAPDQPQPTAPDKPPPAGQQADAPPWQTQSPSGAASGSPPSPPPALQGLRQPGGGQ